MFMTIPGLVLLLIALVAIDRMGRTATRHLHLPWRKEETGRSASAPSIDELHALFYSTKRYELDQRRTSLLLRDEETNAAPPRNEIRMDTRTAIIRGLN